VKFEEEIKNIQAKLKEKDETEQPKVKEQQNEGSKNSNANKETEFSNPITILKHRLNRIISTNLEKRNLID
jgi:hypothetical protein